MTKRGTVPKNVKRTTSRKPTPKRTPKRGQKPNTTKNGHRSTSTALAVVKAPRPELMREEDNPVLPERRLTAEPLALTMGGGVPVKFTKAEELILSEVVNPDEIRIKPTGIPYVSHPTYTRHLNRAFGRGQWALVEISVPTKGGNSVLVKYALLVRGVPVAAAYGEQEFFESNRDQSYGDVVESTYASGLRRCCKHLGIFLEMWDRAFLDAWVDTRCLEVKVKGKDGQIKRQWRRKVDAPFWNEAGRASRDEDDDPRAQRHQPPPQKARTAQAVADPVTATHPKAGDPISEDALKRFWTIARRSGRSDEEIKQFLSSAYGLTSSKDIKRRDYNDITKAIEHPGALRPVLRTTGDRQPGEDG